MVLPQPGPDGPAARQRVDVTKVTDVTEVTTGQTLIRMNLGTAPWPAARTRLSARDCRAARSAANRADMLTIVMTDVRALRLLARPRDVIRMVA
jgi:hypothetical protein